MTTLLGSKKDLTVSIGFFVLVVGAIAVSMFARDKSAAGFVFAAVALGLVILAVVLRRQPANELRISDESIELVRPGRTLGRITREESNASVQVARRIYRGRTFWSLAIAGSPTDAGIQVDDFVPAEIQTAAQQHGWHAVIIE